jgi:hypothetical protein
MYVHIHEINPYWRIFNIIYFTRGEKATMNKTAKNRLLYKKAVQKVAEQMQLYSKLYKR